MAVSRHLLASALGLAVFAMFGGAARADAESCWDDWAEAAEVVRRERLATVAELSERVRAHIGGKLLRTRLCEDNGQFTYRLVVRAPGGVLQPVTVDARAPFGQAPGKHD